MIDKPSPSFEVALQEEFKRFYLAGIETGRKLEREAMKETIQPTMNQIPNIEEINSREVEEIVQEAHKIAIDYMDRVNLKQAAIKNVPYNSPIYLLGPLKDYLRTSIHQQLQKARKDWLRTVQRGIIRVRQKGGMKINGNNFELTDGKVVMTPDDFKFVSNRIQEETAKEIIADYMEALGTVVLPKETWLAIADVNGKYLNKTLKENI